MLILNALPVNFVVGVVLFIAVIAALGVLLTAKNKNKDKDK